jgi:hypothetical protein
MSFETSKSQIWGETGALMPLAAMDDVRRIIGPDREEKLSGAFRKAGDDVAVDISKYSRWPRTRANFHDETVKMVLDDTILARCKKANEDGLGANIDTQANMAFVEAQLDLPGLEGLQKIEIVYDVNQFGTDMDGIAVQARDGDMRLWVYPIPSGAAGAGAGTVVPLPLPPSPPSPLTPTADVSDLVQPRHRPAEEGTNESEK